MAKEFLLEGFRKISTSLRLLLRRRIFLKEFAEESRSLVKDFFLGFEDNKHGCPTFVAVIARIFGSRRDGTTLSQRC